MLIRFSVENFRSFRDRTVLCMDATADTDLKSIVRHVSTKRNVRHLLPVASIHGANASGKSNLIKAARLLDQLVYMAMRYPEGQVPDDLSVFYSPMRQVDCFRLDEQSKSLPTTFEIEFILNEIRWLYEITLDSKKIHSEKLQFWPEGQPVDLFARGRAVDSEKAWLLDRSEIEESKPSGRHVAPIADPQRWQEGQPSASSDTQENWYWGPAFAKGFHEGQALAGRTRPEVPFLSVAASWNHPQAAYVLTWFRHFQVIDATQALSNQTDHISRACRADPNLHDWIQRWMRAADLGISSIAFERQDELEPGTGNRERFQPKAVHQTAEGGFVSFDMQQESHGTNRIFGLALTLYRALEHGGVLVIDELHTGLHPLLLRALVKIFQSPERNKRNAQLVFTTHDVSVLDNSLLRRDQIHIVEKSRGGMSDIYSLSDCEEKPRKDAPLIKYYLSGHLGGVPDLDIDSVFPLVEPAKPEPRQ